MPLHREKQKTTKTKRPAQDKRTAELERRLQEAEETLQAIRSGEADALVVSSPHGERVYTLKDADRPYRLLVEEMNEGAAALTLQGDIVFCNRYLVDCFRLPPDQIIGQPFRRFVAPCDGDQFDELLRQAVVASSKGEIGLGEKDRAAIPVEASLRNLSAVGLPIISMMITDLRERKRTEQRLRELANQIGLMQEDERRRVSRELHDDIGQVLSVLRMSLDYVREDLPPSDEALRQRLLDASHLAEQTIQRIRVLAGTLHPPSMGVVGLNTMLDGYCRAWGQRTGIRASYKGAEAGPVSDDLAIMFYRFLQEVLLNVERYAEAKSVQVELKSEPGGVAVLVEDDGKGFDVRALERACGKRRNGYGLFKMRERFSQFGGRLDIQSSRGCGARLLASVPLESDEPGD